MNTPQATEFLYTWYQDMDDQFPGKWWAHRISKKTKKLVFVQYKVGGYLSRHPSLENLRLDRIELETKGEANWHHGRTLLRCFYTEAGKKRLELKRLSFQYVPECLKALGLTKGATIEDVRRAYHEAALKEHPDTGGTHEGFLLLKKHYESALKITQI
jgi:hypothetical protein